MGLFIPLPLGMDGLNSFVQSDFYRCFIVQYRSMIERCLDEDTKRKVNTIKLRNNEMQIV